MDVWWFAGNALVGGVVGNGTRRWSAVFTDGVPVPRGWCEGACALGFAVIAERCGPSPLLLPMLVLGWWMVTASVVDLRVCRLPNVLTLPGAAVITSVAAVAGSGRAAVGGALLLAGAYLVLHLTAPSGMGAGDVKLALGLGAVTGVGGASVWLCAAVLAPVLTAVVGLARRRARRPVPHGPSMCVATAVALWWL